jgi:hypothetical protein
LLPHLNFGLYQETEKPVDHFGTHDRTSYH